MNFNHIYSWDINLLPNLNNIDKIDTSYKVEAIVGSVLSI